MKAVYLSIAFFIGLLVPFQAIINSKLATTLNSAVASALISFTGGFLIFLIINFFTPDPMLPIKQLGNVPPYLLTGGLIGAVFIITAIFILPKLGPTVWVGLIISGQLTMSLLLDHYGFMGVPVHPINMYRILGAIALVLGSTLVLKF